ncbi:hypothetical protein B0H12DRAFT_1074017 [Mycena haematopus]|nr:hypothetical protein B0H12DRAFT_1074017 [Mycena haematopus]
MEVVNDDEELGWKGSTTGDGRHGGTGDMAGKVVGEKKETTWRWPFGVTLDLRRQYSQRYSELVMAMANSPHAERNGRKRLKLGKRLDLNAWTLHFDPHLKPLACMLQPPVFHRRIPAQREASARYRQRNQTELKQKARDRMARCLTSMRSTKSVHAKPALGTVNNIGDISRVGRWTVAPFRDPNCDRAFIQKHGYDAWLKRRPSHEDDETLEPEPEPEPEQAGEPEPEQAGEPTPDLSDPDVAIEADPRDPDAELNYWLDHLDPTTAPDYVPKPGERPYFRWGKRRWD